MRAGTDTIIHNLPLTGAGVWRHAVSEPERQSSSRSIHREHAYRIAAGLIVGDWLAACVAIFTGLQIREWQRAAGGGSVDLSSFHLSPALMPWALGGGALFVWFMVLLKTYEVSNLYRTHRWAQNLFKSALLWVMTAWAYIGVFPEMNFSPRVGAAYCAVALVMFGGLWRMSSFMFLIRPKVRRAASSRVIVVGWSDKSEHLRRAMREDPAELSEMIGCVPLPSGRFAMRPPPELAILGSFSSLPRIVSECDANSIILTETACHPRAIQDLIAFCQREMLGFRMVPEYFPALHSGLQVEALSGVPLLGVSRLPLDWTVNRMIKRVMDVVGATIGLAISLPICAVFATFVYLESPGPVIHRQRRTSRSGRTFLIYKIRSMRLNAEAESGAVWCKQDDPRRLRIGALMRKYNIDELPQFWNVLKGDMSLVGPRPERPELIEKFKDEIPNYNARHEVRTGLTGWAQIHGWRGDTDLRRRIEADLYYLENWSPLLDLYCVLATLVSFKNAH